MLRSNQYTKLPPRDTSTQPRQFKQSAINLATGSARPRPQGAPLWARFPDLTPGPGFQKTRSKALGSGLTLAHRVSSLTRRRTCAQNVRNRFKSSSSATNVIRPMRCWRALDDTTRSSGCSYKCNDHWAANLGRRLMAPCTRSMTGFTPPFVE
jgi:hypothetical protein